MPLKYDPEYFKAFEPLIPMLAARPKPAVHDIEARRQSMEAAITLFKDAMPAAPDVERQEHSITTPAGVTLPVFSFFKKGTSTSSETTPGPAILHCHGGGMILGSVRMSSQGIAWEVQQTGVPIFSVEYRVAPESSGTNLVEDCYAGLVWLSQNAASFNVDPARIAVFGESAGGGIAAGVALMARDRNLSPPLAKQILIYPMLDDRNCIPNARLEPFAFWKVEDNITGWTALLGADKAGKPDADVPYYCAPARAKSLADLPPTYIDTGGLDIFRDEDIEYARRLALEDIEVEFHLYPGVPHAFEIFAPNATVTKRAFEHRFKSMMSF
ncbi:uncharacterized protein Z520_00674 [Fonsecaea multimorphosa CBS 102226]|uniref:Alpha/beta hydrolase fold-3 domain-containing protein n=1 Tax=Fonsecaea multimorphosa CBS 102226 TaxID=1442371 RepID=A0A0D2J3M3_9EURO|nr:uncharacterized protein Z520_00674 [Fonsecaea multimorphosa CBS 102226]KIY03982.1 hypothetical protein Z520_00674 [Fonsecaea multimorphosa CBS 102226]OAL31821.1 hypothetical protein AYO22_00691 [Fonsecaea multimorphosa]